MKLNICNTSRNARVHILGTKMFLTANLSRFVKVVDSSKVGRAAAVGPAEFVGEPWAVNSRAASSKRIEVPVPNDRVFLTQQSNIDE